MSYDSAFDRAQGWSSCTRGDWHKDYNNFVAALGQSRADQCFVPTSGAPSPGPTPTPPTPKPVGTELAQGKPTTQSSEGWGGASQRAVDGNTDGIYGSQTCTHTHAGAKEWWRVDLQQTADISSVQIWNREDCCGERLDGARIKVGATDDVDAASPCATVDSVGAGGNKAFGCASTGRFVFIQNAPNQYLTLCEVKVFGTVRTGTELAQGKPTTQSSEGWDGASLRAVDGNTDGIYGSQTCAHTHAGAKEWWRVDLQQTADITSVQIWNRQDCCGERLDGARIKVGATDDVDAASPCATVDSIG